MNEPDPAVIADRYEIIGTLGEGGMGIVHKAHDRLLKIDVALKMMREMDASSSSNMMMRFQQEAKAAGRLNHPNVARVIDFGQISGKPYMVMALLDGTPLSTRIEDSGRLSTAVALPIFIDICEGLAHAHKMGVLHRDLKPSNIIITTGGGDAKIVDFGVAKLATSQHLVTSTGVQVGSPLYMSPEQAKGKEADSRSEIYSMGCLMYETLSGQVPIKSGSVIETLHKKANEPAKSLAVVNNEVPAELVEVVDRCLAINPDDRFKDVNALLKALNDSEEAIAMRAELLAEGAEEPHDAHEELNTRGSLKTSTIIWTMTIALFTIGVGAFVWTLAFSDESEVPRNVKKLEVKRSPEKLADFVEQRQKQEPAPFKFEPNGTVVTNHESLTNLDPRFKQLERRRIEKLIMSSYSEVDGSGLKYINKAPLKHLEIDHTSFLGENMRYVGQFKNLESFKIHFAPVTDDQFKHLETLSKLTRLDLAGLDYITDAGFKHIAKLKNLNYVAITDCKKVGDGAAAQLALLPKLDYVSFSRIPLTGKGIRQLGEIKLVKIIELVGVEPSAENLEAMSQLKVTELRLKDVQLRPEDVQQLAKMPRLMSFVYGGTEVNVSPQLISALNSIPKLHAVRLEYCTLTLDAMRALSKLKKLDYLSFREVNVPTQSLEYLMEMPNLVACYNYPNAFSNSKFNKFLRKYEEKYKRKLWHDPK